MKWPPPQPAGALYITHTFEAPVVIAADGKTGRLEGTGPVERVQVASNGVAFAGKTGASLRLYRLSGSSSKALPSLGRTLADPFGRSARRRRQCGGV